MGDRYLKLFMDHRLYLARLISGSKSMYRKQFPDDNTIIFNANIFTKSHGKIWYGDLHISKDCQNLQKIVNKIGEEMIIVSEMFGRFGAEDRKYKEIHKDAFFKFVPNRNFYYERKTAEGVVLVKIKSWGNILRGKHKKGWKKNKI